MKQEEQAKFQRFQAVRFPMHSCELPPAPDRIFPQLAPNAPLWLRARRLLQLQLVAWRASRPLRLMRPSNMQFEYEQAHHIRSKCWWVIHPMSRFYMIWQAIILVSILQGLIVWPLACAFGNWRFVLGVEAEKERMPQWDPIDPKVVRRNDETLDTFREVLDIVIGTETLVYWLHILIKFNTGYVHRQSNSVIMKPIKIVWHYLKTLFIIDLISCVLYLNEGVNRVFYGTHNIPIMAEPAGREYRYISYGLGAMHILRTYELYCILVNWFEFFNFPRDLKTILYITLFYIIFVHWVACMSVFIPIQFHGKYIFSTNSNSWMNDRNTLMLYANTSIMEKYSTALLRIIRISRGALTVHTQKGTTTDDYLMVMFTLCVGLLIQFYTMAVIIEVIGSKGRPEIKYPQVMLEVHNFMRERQLPVHLRQKILLYYSHTLQGRYVRERAVLANMPNSMREAIKLATCQRLVSSSVLFQNLPKSLILGVIDCLKEELYMTSDVVYTFRSEAKGMYFLSLGTVAMLAPTGEELGHLDDGSYFGEMELISHERRRVLSVIALEVCEIFFLSRRDFRRVFKPYPRLFNRVRAAAIQRAGELMEWDELTRRNLDKTRKAPTPADMMDNELHESD